MAATLSKAKIKWVNQLSQKKYRKLEGLFVAEGDKMVQDMLDHFVCRALFYTSEYTGKIVAKEACQVTYDELCRLSRLQTPQHVLAVFEMPATQLHV